MNAATVTTAMTTTKLETMMMKKTVNANTRSIAAVLLAAACAAAAPASAQQTAAPPAAWVEEVPFITTPDKVTLEMLRIAEVQAGDHVIDLGSGDGRIVITAAKRFGATGLGVEIVPDLVRQSLDNARRAGVEGRVEFRELDIFQTDLSKATVVTLYLLPEVNLRLRPALLALAPGTRIVSHDWDMGDWKPDRSVVLEVPEKEIGLEKRSRVHLWRVPAPVDGLWCAGPLRLRFAQSFQHYRATLEGPGDARQSWTGRIEGASLPPPAGGPLRPWLDWRDAALRTRHAMPGIPAGTRFERGGSACQGGLLHQGPALSQPGSKG